MIKTLGFRNHASPDLALKEPLLPAIMGFRLLTIRRHQQNQLSLSG